MASLLHIVLKNFCRSQKLLALSRADQAALELRDATKDREHKSRHGRVLTGERKVLLAELDSNVARVQLRSGSEGPACFAPGDLSRERPGRHRRHVFEGAIIMPRLLDCQEDNSI